MAVCIRKNCGKPLTGRQTKYHSVGCKTADAIDARRMQFKIRAVQLLGGSCTKCGYNQSYVALQFHHRDPKTKKFRLSSMYRYSWDKAVLELEKCDLLCANCHVVLHHGE